MSKSPGQIAYEMDCAASPTYADGEVRKSWDRLDDIARWSWERDPSPRLYPGERRVIADAKQ